uniref:Uncharacterized protein n=1 Tax=Avena sativa TaxID=4498 RepID=A0ACD5TXF0_AVESA
MAVETRIRAGAPTRFNKFDGERGAISSVHLRCRVTFEHASRRLRGGGTAVPNRVKPETQQQKPWTSDEVRPLRDPSVLLRPDDTLRAVLDMLAAAPWLRGVDLAREANWDGKYTPRRVAAWLHEQGSRWLGGERQPCCRFEVEARLEVRLVFSEPRAVLRRCLEVAMQTVVPGSDEECGICLDEFRNAAKSGPVNLPCSHAFHRHCMLTWLDRGNNCPACRHDLTGMVRRRRWRRRATLLRPEPDGGSRVGRR